MGLFLDICLKSGQISRNSWTYVHIFKLNTGQISSYFWIFVRISDKNPEIAGLLSTGLISRNSWIVRKRPEIAGRMSRKFFTVYFIETFGGMHLETMLYL